MKDWKKREKHNKEVKEILQQHNAITEGNVITCWNGQIRNALKEKGHTSVGFNTCECKQK